jgi:DNA-binding NarL/FixJ family response regulator
MAVRVLVVDDDPIFRDLARRLLVLGGLTVVGEADSVATARAAAGALRPDAVLVDVGLPDGDGVELARELGVLPWAPRVLLTSSDADAATDDDAARVGASAFVAKDELPNAPIARLLSRP